MSMQFLGGLLNVYVYLQGGGGQKWLKSCLRRKSMTPQNKMANYLVNQPIFSDDFIRSYETIRSQKSRHFPMLTSPHQYAMFTYFPIWCMSSIGFLKNYIFSGLNTFQAIKLVWHQKVQSKKLFKQKSSFKLILHSTIH